MDDIKDRPRERALSLEDFCDRYGIGRTRFYVEKRLAGRRPNALARRFSSSKTTPRSG
jgi:hypothetical protein